VASTKQLSSDRERRRRRDACAANERFFRSLRSRATDIAADSLRREAIHDGRELSRCDAFRAHERAGSRGEIRDAHTDDEDAPPGDATARFNNLVLPHLGDAYSLARWITGSRADAEDVVQHACVRAFRAIAGFAGGNAPNVASSDRQCDADARWSPQRIPPEHNLATKARVTNLRMNASCE
jgi:hypothetical protein